MKKAGIGLIEVMLALGLAGVLVAVLMHLSKQQNDQSKKAFRDVELTELYNQFVTMYNTKTPCNATFEGVKLGDTINEFRVSKLDFSQPPFAETGKTFQGLKVSIDEMKILTNDEISALKASSMPNLSLTTVSAADNYGQANIQFRVKFNRGKITGASQTTQKVFTIPVMMAKYVVVPESSELGVKEECWNTWGGKIADDEMEIDKPGYNDGTAATNPEPVHCVGVNCWGHCLIANNAIPVSEMQVVKCNTNK